MNGPVLLKRWKRWMNIAMIIAISIFVDHLKFMELKIKVDLLILSKTYLKKLYLKKISKMIKQFCSLLILVNAWIYRPDQTYISDL